MKYYNLLTLYTCLIVTEYIILFLTSLHLSVNR